MGNDEPGPMAENAPYLTEKLIEIAKEACTQTFQGVTEYEHEQTSSWNNKIIGHILSQLLSKQPSNTTSPSPYKYVVNSTILQSEFPPLSLHADSDTDDAKTKQATRAGKRGMHSATGAFWNTAKDGTWSYKWEGAEEGFDVVISVFWISVQ